MGEPLRVLIDFDYEAAGIWKVLSRSEMNAPPAQGGWTGPAPLHPNPPRPRPWSDRLPVSLLDSLEEWNDVGVRVISRGEGGPGEVDAFWVRGAELARAVQGVLGSEYQVLYSVPEGAWTWVRPPWWNAAGAGS